MKYILEGIRSGLVSTIRHESSGPSWQGDGDGSGGDFGNMVYMRRKCPSSQGDEELSERKGMIVQQRSVSRWVIALMSLTFGMAQTLWAEPIEKGWAIPVQVPYEAPPKGQDLPAESVPQNTKPLTPQEIQRAEALLP